METATSIEEIVLDNYAFALGWKHLMRRAVRAGIIFGGLFAIGFFVVICILKPMTLSIIVVLFFLSIVNGFPFGCIVVVLFMWRFSGRFLGKEAKAKIISSLSNQDKQKIVSIYIEKFAIKA